MVNLLASFTGVSLAGGHQCPLYCNLTYMGLDYSIDLYIPADKVEALLLVTADVVLRPAKSTFVNQKSGRAQIVPRGE
jgi:hypothetical protein